VRLLLGALLAASTVAACAATVRATCEEIELTQPPTLSCEQVIDAARAEFASTLGITELVVDYGDCPIGRRGCQLGAGKSAKVYAFLADGSRLSVSVRIDPDGSIRSNAPEPVPSSGP
jgi:hypothetical protein